MNALEFIELLADKHLLSDKVVAKLRRQIEQSAKRVSAKSVAKLLVAKGQLTADQADRLLATPPVPPSPPPLPSKQDDDDLGLAPDELEELTVADDELVDINDDDGMDPVQIVEPLDEEEVAGDSAESHDDAWGQNDLGDDLHDDDHDDELLGEVSDAADAGRQIVTRQRGIGGVFAQLRSRKGPRKISANRWDSPLMLVGGGSLLVLLVVGLALYFLLSRGTGDDLYNAANDSYRQQSYTQAINLFQQFVDEYPDHPKVSSAKVRIGTAQIWSHVERQRWQEALDTVRTQMPVLMNEEAFAEARPELASLLPEIMDGFADQALGAEGISDSEKYLASANEALVEVDNSAYLPTSVRKGQQARIDQIVAKLERVKRRINRDRQLESTIVEIRDAASEGQIGRAYGLRKELLRAYPSLETDARLDAVVLEVTETERTAVRPLSNVSTPLNDEPPTASQFRVALANRRGDQVADLADQVVFVTTQGAVYGLDASDGSVLWRRHVGFGNDVPPVDLQQAGASDVIVVDQRRQEIARLDGKTGTTVWRLPCPGQPSRPRLGAGRLWLACGEAEQGHVLAVDPETGEIVGGATLPVPVSVSPAIDVDNQTVIQVATHSSIYVFSMEDFKCLGVSYLGHASDTVVVTPIVIGGAMIVPENPGIDFSLLHILGHDPEKPGHVRRLADPLRLDGQVVVSPQVFGRRLVVATDRGRTIGLEFDLDQSPSPLRVAAEAVATVPAGTPSYFVLDKGRLWVADVQLTRYELQTSRGKLVRKWLNSKGDRFVAPLQLLGNTLIHVRRRAGKLGATVAAVHVGEDRSGLNEGETVWEVDLGVPSAGEPFIDRAAQEINVVSGNGALFAVGKDAIRTGLVRSARQEVLDPRLPALVDSISLNSKIRVFCPVAGSQQVVVLDTSADDPSLRSVKLDLAGQRPAEMPVAFQEQLAVPTTAGAVYLLDSARGAPTMAPFQPAMNTGGDIAWQRPAVSPDGDKLLLSDRRGNVYQLAVDTDPQSHLTAIQQRQLDAPPVTRPALFDDSVLLVVHGGQQDILRQLNLSDLQMSGQVNLPGRVVWGPKVVGGKALLMTDEGKLLAVDSAREELAVDVWAGDALTHPVVGNPAVYKEGVVLATVDGVLWYLHFESGQVLAKIEVGESLGTGPVLFSGNRFILCGGDGTLHVVAVTAE